MPDCPPESSPHSELINSNLSFNYWLLRLTTLAIPCMSPRGSIQSAEKTTCFPPVIAASTSGMAAVLFGFKSDYALMATSSH